ncbi:MAG: hypothetical protein AB1488_09420 [Nitrospirota bacterium]
MPKTAGIAPIEDREAKEYVYHILTKGDSRGENRTVPFFQMLSLP